MARIFPAQPVRVKTGETSRFCPHVALVAILTPGVWIALIYLLLTR